MKADSIKEKFNRIAVRYNLYRKNLIPCYDDFYMTSISFLSHMRKNFKKVLDLGAGTGILTGYLYEQFPEAEYTLMDVSDQMLNVARQRFRNNNIFYYMNEDYSVTLPSEKFDLIASALSFHCIDEKRALYSNIYSHLETGGYFVLLDRFSSSNDFIERHYNEWCNEYIAKGKIHDMDNESYRNSNDLTNNSSISEVKATISTAGFKTVECIYSFMQFGVILAIK